MGRPEGSGGPKAGRSPTWVEARGYWRATYFDLDGKEHEVQVRTPGAPGRKECARRKKVALDRVARSLVPTAKLTVGNYLDTWLEVWVMNRPTLSPRSRDDYRDTVERYIRPYFDTRSLATLTGDDVQKWINWLARQPLHRTVFRPDPAADPATRPPRKIRVAIPVPGTHLSGTTTNHAVGILSSVLDKAVGARHIAYNPVKSASRPPKDTEELAVWSPQELADFLDWMDDTDTFKPLVVTAALLGMRQSELVALTWADLTLDGETFTGTARIRFQLARGKQGARDRVRLKTPDSKATVEIPNVVVACLLDWRRNQREIRIAHAKVWPDNDYVFTTDAGQPRLQRNVARLFALRQQQCNEARAAAGLKPLQHQVWHYLRHQAASFQFAMGAREQEVEAFLRHAPNSGVGRRYTHLLPRARTDAAERMNLLFPLARNRRKGEG